MKSIQSYTLVFLLLAAGCSQWEIVRRAGSPPTDSAEDRVEVKSKTVFREINFEKKRQFYKEMNRRYLKRLYRLGKAKPQHEELALRALQRDYFEIFARRRDNMRVPQQKTELYAYYDFDEDKYRQLVKQDYFARHGLELLKPAMQQPMSKNLIHLLRSYNQLFNAVGSTAKIKIWKSQKLYLAPKKRIRRIIKLWQSMPSFPLAFSYSQDSSSAQKGERTGGGKSAKPKEGNRRLQLRAEWKNSDKQQKDFKNLLENHSQKIAADLKRVRFVALKKWLKQQIPETNQTPSLIAKISQRINKANDMAEQIALTDKDILLNIHKLYQAARVCSDGAAQQKFNQLVPLLEGTSFQLHISHPEGTGYLNSGYENPATIRLLRDNRLQAGYVRVRPKGGRATLSAHPKGLKPQKAFFMDGSDPLSLYITTLSETGIKLQFQIRFPEQKKADPFFQKVYGRALGASLPAQKLKLKNISQHVSSTYASQSSRYSRSAIASLKNDRVSIKASAIGQFTLGGFIRGKRQDYLYGHPNGRGPDGIWSSFITVQIDGKNLKLKDLAREKIKTRLLDDKYLQTIYQLPHKLQLIRTLTYDKKEQRSIVKIDIANQGKESRQVGLRLLLDTWAGDNDGVPFRLPRQDKQQKKGYSSSPVIIREKEIYGKDIQYFEATELGNQEKIVLRGDFPLKDSLRPDRVILASWGSAHGSIWQYTASPYRSITHDSAVLIYYLSRGLEPKQQLSYGIRFGQRIMKNNIYLPEVVTPADPFFLASVGYFNSAQKSKKVHIELESADPKLELVNGGNAVTLKIPPQKEKIAYFQLGVTGYGNGETKVLIHVTEDGQRQTYERQVTIQGEQMSLMQRQLSQEDKFFPVRFATFGRQLKPNTWLIAVLYNSKGQELQRIRLYDDGNHSDKEKNDAIYGNRFALEQIEAKDLRVKIFEYSLPETQAKQGKNEQKSKTP